MTIDAQEILKREGFADWAIPVIDRAMELRVFIDHPEFFSEEGEPRILTWADIMNLPLKQSEISALQKRWDEVAKKIAINPERIPLVFTESCNVFRVNMLQTILAPVNEVWGYATFDERNSVTKEVIDVVGGDLYTVFVQSINAQHAGVKDNATDKYRNEISRVIGPDMLQAIKDRIFLLNSVLAFRRMAGKDGKDARVKDVKRGEVKMVFAMAELTKKIVKAVESGQSIPPDVVDDQLHEILQPYDPELENMTGIKLRYYLGENRWEHWKRSVLEA